MSRILSPLGSTVPVPSTDLNQKDWQEVRMFICKNLVEGTPATIVVRKMTKNRLRETCFRGTGMKKAGNFSRWNSAKELFRDKVVLEWFLGHIAELCYKVDVGTYSCCLRSYPGHVGWESTDWLRKYDSEDLEEFVLNRKSTGLRVKFDRVDLRAPKTCSLTIVFELKEEHRRPVAVIHSIYPGEDVGELVGNVTERESRVFFDWDHPGED